jgi:hypothetical protein
MYAGYALKIEDAKTTGGMSIKLDNLVQESESRLKPTQEKVERRRKKLSAKVAQNIGQILTKGKRAV